MKKYVLFILALAILFGSVAAIAENTHKEISTPKMVRVAIVRDARELNLEIEGSYAFINLENGRTVTTGKKLVKSKIRLLDKGIFMGTNVYPLSKMIIRPARNSSVIINNHNFRGDVLIMRMPNNRITAINSIDIEDYIKGVLYHEVSHHWPMEALKAQAVAARTYALYKMEGSHKADFDVTNDIYSQVYGGKDSERYRTGLAVDRTLGQVLTYQKKILPAYFHATCAGMTEDAAEMWDINIKPLKGVPCMFCQNSPHIKWKKNFKLSDIQQSLNQRGYKIGKIKDIYVEERDRSDRIKKLKITDREGNNLSINGKDFREALGPNELKSNNYIVTMQGYYVDFIGKGWGHGVGLCQWGAKGMSDQQFTYKQILAYYYPGSEMVDYHDIISINPATKPVSTSKTKSPNK